MQTPLDVLGTFSCEISMERNTVNSEFCVIDGKANPLLGRETATNLSLLKVRIDTTAVNTCFDKILVKPCNRNTQKSLVVLES